MSDNLATDRILDKLEKIVEKLGGHDVLLTEIDGRLNTYNAQLEIHIKRSSLLEDNQAAYEKTTNRQLEVALQPIKSAKWLIKLAAGLITLISLLKLTGVIK
jgi:hypothetical protein